MPIFNDPSFDCFFDDLRYVPWVGKDYRSSAIRILVVAESLYDWDQGSDTSKESLLKRNFVQQCVREMGLYFDMENPWKGSDKKKLYRMRSISAG